MLNLSCLPRATISSLVSTASPVSGMNGCRVARSKAAALLVTTSPASATPDNATDSKHPTAAAPVFLMRKQLLDTQSGSKGLSFPARIS